MSTPRRSHRRERGIAVPLFSLMVVILVAAVTVSVDLGSRYSEAAKIQRAADAAALAAVTVLPRGLAVAEAEARQVAARNGYTHGVDDITVDLRQVTAESVQVTIRNASVPTYFADFFSGGSTFVERRATAEFIRAVSLGSPRNFLGTGDLLGGSNAGDMNRLRHGAGASLSTGATAALRENYWLAISGTCSSRENGDRYTALTGANYGNTGNPRGPSESASPFTCTGGNTVANPEYRDYGYIYAVTVPPGFTGPSVEIQVFDPAVCNGSRPGDSSSGGMATRYTVRTGSINPLSGTVLSDVSYPSTNSDCSTWVTLTTVTPPASGATYYLQVRAGQNSNSGPRSNGFALRARDDRSTSSRFWGCSSDPTDGTLFAGDCPHVYAVNDMGVYASLTGARAEFFLAEVTPEYNGKRLELALFDPGEGADSLRIKDPTGNYATFDWDVDCAGVTAPTGGCSGTDVTRLDLIGATRNDCSDGMDVDTGPPTGADRCAYNPQPGSRRVSRWKYNDRLLTLSIDLPADIEAAYGGATWWKVEYTTNTAPTDRTTWAVQVQGDPVRLVPNSP